MASVLIVDDDLGVRETFSISLSAVGHDVSTAATGTEAVRLCARIRPDVAFVDVFLPDASGLDLLPAIRRASVCTTVVMMTGFATMRSAVHAMRCGAHDYLEKPVDIDDVVRIVSTLDVVPSLSTLPPPQPHAAARWAAVVAKVVNSPTDLNTVSRWGRAVGASSGAIRLWCRSARQPAKRSLNLARMLRVVMQYDGSRRLTDLLDIVDARTLAAFLRLGNPSGAPAVLPMTVEEYLARQQWITDPYALDELRRALARTGSPDEPATM